MRIRLVSMALVLVLGAGACGGDGDDAGDDEALSTTTTTGTSTTAAAAAGTSSTSAAPPATGDQAVVDKIVLQASDFPAGWTSTPPDTGRDKSGERALAECLGITFSPDRPEAESPRFSKGQLTQVNSSAQLMATADVAAADFAALKGPKASSCITRQFDQTLASSAAGVTFTPSKYSALEAPKLPVDEALSVRLTTGISTPDGGNVPIYADFVFIRNGRAEVSVSFINATQPFDQTLAGDLTKRLASRA
jgi:hypothetical protein